ncbi:MAG: hypothetical protein ACRD1R_19315 [Acidobacteriota bacterium]
MPSRFESFDQTLNKIIENWYQRLKHHYVTEQDSQELGIEPELKRFHEIGSHRIKFSREREIDVTYGLRVEATDGEVVLESSVNNKSAGFDYEAFVNKLQAYYWRTRNEKPWTDPEFDRFTYGDLMSFEPRLGESVTLDHRQERADIIRLHFVVNPRHTELLISHPEILQDLIDNYCLAPLKRIYAETFREYRPEA